MSGEDPDFEIEGRDWPNRASSRFVDAAGIRWHVQQCGAGPPLLLVHGTASGTHSWRALMPRLARRFAVTAFDLPGHAFSSRPAAERLSLPGMAAAIGALLERLGVRPQICIGHSAGAAIIARLALDGRVAPALLVSLNGALLPLRNVPSHVVAPVALLLTGSTLVPRVLAWRMASAAPFRALMARTGSTLEPFGYELYQRLARKPGHVAAALGMMSYWDVRPFARELGALPGALVLVSGANDGMVAPDEGERVRALVSGARHVVLPGVGHLAHEERPEEFAELLIGYAQEHRLLEA